MQYSSPQFWQCNLYKWIELKDRYRIHEKRNEIIESIVVACNDKLSDIETIVDGKFSGSDIEKKADNEDRISKRIAFNIPYIKFPKLEFEKSGVNFNVSLRINPCISYPEEENHYSKIWVIAETEQKELENIEVKEIFSSFAPSAKRLAETVRDLYIDKGGIPECRSQYSIKAYNVGTSKLENDKTSILFSNKEGEARQVLENDLTASVITDLLSINYKKDVESPEQLISTLDWQVAKANGTSLLYGARFMPEETVISGFANTGNSEKMHALFRPVAIRLANIL